MAMATCRRAGCPFSNRDGRRHHGFCCNACRRDEGHHTKNCTVWMSIFQNNGYTQTQNPMPAGNLLPTMQNPIPMRSQVGFLIPHSWKSDHKFIDHIGWYMTRFGLQMDKATEENWLTMQKMANLKEPNWERELLIHVRSESNQGTVPLINLTKYDLDAHSSMYDSRQVSGLWFEVQSRLLSQPACASAMYAAVEKIEGGAFAEFTFVCIHATHRSVGMACLLATLFYNRAIIIVLSTKRTYE